MSCLNLILLGFDVIFLNIIKVLMRMHLCTAINDTNYVLQFIIKIYIFYYVLTK